jgi:hypothetical protein
MLFEGRVQRLEWRAQATNCAYYMGADRYRLVRLLYCKFDICIGSLILLVLFLISLFSAVVSPIQTTLLFNEGVVRRIDIARVAMTPSRASLATPVGASTAQPQPQPNQPPRAVPISEPEEPSPEEPSPEEPSSAPAPAISRSADEHQLFNDAQMAAGMNASLQDGMAAREPEPEPELPRWMTAMDRGESRSVGRAVITPHPALVCTVSPYDARRRPSRKTVRPLHVHRRS